MGASLEALAMAGADYAECDIDLEALDEVYPPHLLVLQDGVKPKEGGDEWRVDEEEMKARLVAWAKAVASLIREKFSR